MAKKKLNKYIGTVILGTAILAVPGCSDTWDEHYEGGDNGNVATKTLWEQITSNPDLSRFAEIARRAKYYRDEKHPVSTYTYADVLKGGQVNTVWAPENSAISDEEYQRLLDMAETDGYNLQQQFIGNHIALWRHAFSGTDVDTVKTINGKNLIFDKGKGTFQNEALNLKNVAAVNGTLHTLKGVTQFNYNLYEYLKFGGTTTTMRDYVIARDTTYFSAGASIEGRPDENGNPTYVDSVYFTSNRMLNTTYYLPNTGADSWMMYEKSFGEPIQLEDSSYLMVIPTDAGWTEAYNKLKPYYNYATSYEDKQKGTQGTTLVYSGLNPDSLAEMSINMDIVSPLVFNVHKQGKPDGQKEGPVWELETFIPTKGASAQYFLNSVGDTLRNTPTWDKTSLFEGTQVKMSNGYGYLVDSWNYPIEFYKPDVVVEMGYYMFYNTSNSAYYKAGSGTSSQTFNNENYKDITSKYGKVSDNNFYLLENPGASSGALVEVALYGNYAGAYVPNAKVMSGKYDIQVVVVPYYYKMIADAGVIDSSYYDSLYVDSVAKKNMNKFQARVRYNNGGSRDVQSRWVSCTTQGLCVDTVTVAEDFEFPYSYKNLRYSYPTLLINSNPSASDRRNGYILPICIDQIILKSKENGDVIVVDPNE